MCTMALYHGLVPLCAVRLVNKAPHILLASPVQDSEKEKENRGEKSMNIFSAVPT